MARGMGYKIGFEGETEFMNAVKQMNAQLRTLQTEMQAVTSAFDREDQSQEKLTAQNQVLTRQIEMQSQKVEMQRRLLEEARQAYDENSTVVQHYAQQLNRAVADLNNMERSLRQNETAIENMGEAADDAGDALEGLDGGMESGSSRADMFASVLGGNLAAKGLEVVAQAAIDAAKQIAEFCAESSESLSKLQAQLGLTEEQSKEYKQAALDVYGSGMTDSMEEAADAVAKVGQQMRSLPADKLGDVADNAIMMEKVFGIDVQESLRGADALMRQFGLSAEEAYDIMTVGAQKGLNQNGDLADQIAEYGVNFAEAGYSAEQMFSLWMSGAEKGTFQIDGLSDAVREFNINAKDTGKSDAFQTLGLDAEKMFAMFAEGGQQAQEAAQIVNQALFEMGDKVKQNEVGVALYGSKWEDMGRGTIQAIAEMKEEIGSIDGAAQAAADAMLSSFPAKMQQLQQEVQAAVLGITEGTLTPEQFTTRITEIITEMGSTISANVPMMLDKGLELVEGLGEGLAEALPELVPHAVDLVTGIAETLIAHIPDILACGAEIVGGLISGLISAVPDLIAAVPALMVSLVEAFGEFITNFYEVGSDIVMGIWSGIKEAWDKLKNGLKSLLNGLIKTSRNELDVNSPSKKFRDEVGKPIVEGITAGMEKKATEAEKAIEKISKNLLKSAEDYVKDKKSLNEMSLQDEGAFWEDLKSMEELQSEEISKIDQKIAENKKAIMDEEKKLMEEHEKSVQSRTDALQRFAGLFDEINSEEVSGKDLLANLEGQVAAFKEWQATMEELQGKGVAGELLDELRQLGPGSADEVAALNKLTEKELDRYIQLFHEKGQLAKQEAQKEVGPLLIAEAAQDAIGTLKKDLQTDAAQIGSSVVGAVSSAVTGASEATQEQNFLTITEGMATQEPILEEYIEALKDRLIALIESYRGEFANVGNLMMEGVAQGIRDGESGVVNAVAAVIAAAVSQAKSDLDIHSPSKVFAEIGGYMASGLDKGWTDRMADISRSISGSLASIASPPVAAQGAQAAGNRNYSYGDINLYIDTVNNGNDRDVRRMATELEFFRRQQSMARGR